MTLLSYNCIIVNVNKKHTRLQNIPGGTKFYFRWEKWLMAMKVGQKKRQLSDEEMERLQGIWRKAGKLIREKRELQGHSVRALGDLINVTGNYISEIERGIKPASDEVIRELAPHLYVDETELFNVYEKTPLRVREELEEAEALRNIIDEINKKEIPPKYKTKLYNKFQKAYIETLQEMEQDIKKEEAKLERDDKGRFISNKKKK